MATREERCVKRLIQVATRPKTELEEKNQEVALWSLKSNAQQHNKVLAICKAELKRDPSSRKLLSVVEEARRR
ncbi:MAG: hypothetical protein HY093_00920 [Candidatus Liptonbacteria bacterium]|nr:hypothetical protein [Candidatus Liptonbacteria bacterium]